MSATGQPIAILDFGSQYTQLIARRIRELNVYSVILPCNAGWEKIEALHPLGIVLSGGPSSVYDQDAPAAPPEVLRSGLPLLGICYGLHWMVQALGGQVRTSERREYGRAKIEFESNSALFSGLEPQETVWMSHGDTVERLPPGFHPTAHSGGLLAAAENSVARMYAVQFHPEVRHTEHGREILANFLFSICRATPDWTPGAFVREQVETIRHQVGAGSALCALSGGVDSTVAATLVHRALGGRLTCVFVNNGLLRLREFEKVQQALRERLGLRLRAVDASQRFLDALQNVSDPETKRKRIGAEFISVFEQEARGMDAGPGGRPQFLVQGTLYPDVIESVSVHGPSAVIKSHHNVGGLPPDLKFKLIEPLRMLFKDEVRRIGLELGLGEDLVWRQPFPGPGLAVRILGPVTPEKISLLQHADDIAAEEIKRAGLYRSLWQSFMVLLPVQSVGVMGDFRTYGYTAVLRAVHSEDGMTADWAHLPYDLLSVISTRVINEVRGINRVVYDISSKPPATIEWE